MSEPYIEPTKEEIHDRGEFKRGDLVTITDKFPKVTTQGEAHQIRTGQLAIVREVWQPNQRMPFPITVNMRLANGVTLRAFPVLAKEIRKGWIS